MDTNVWKSERIPGEVGLAIGRAGNGPDPIVCLHGITAQHRAFNAAARHLGPSRGLVGVDLRGRGDSDKPGSGYGLATHASDVVRILDYLGLENAVLLGHSMGAFVALKTALASPDRGLTMDDLPSDLADYYLYDLGEVEGGYNPKTSRAAAEEDSPSVSTSPT